jgi:hypothetical protein
MGRASVHLNLLPSKATDVLLCSFAFGAYIGRRLENLILILINPM